MAQPITRWSAYLPPEGWVAYHGTSSVFADRIEAGGLSPEHGVRTAEDCRAVCEVFEKLQWFGLGNGGFVVLRPWGPDRDVPMTGHRHIYLAESYSHAAVYARAPGGETSKVLLESLEDLVRFQADEELRARHVVQLRCKLDDLACMMGSPHGAGEGSRADSSAAHGILNAIGLTEDISWLSPRNEAFRPLHERLRDIASQHQPVVYAVLVDKAMLRGGAFSMAMGIEIAKAIPPSQIIAKAFPVASRKSDREIGPETPGGHVDALFELWAKWDSRVEEANTYCPRAEGVASHKGQAYAPALRTLFRLD